MAAAALGGERVTTTIEGRDRFPVNVRYAPDFRDNLRKIGEVLVPVSKDEQIPLAELAEIQMRQGPDMIRDEDGELSGYVYVDLSSSDIGGYVQKAKAAIQKAVPFPPGYRYEFSGQYKQMEKAEKRLLVVGPLALFLIALLLYFNTGSWAEAGIVLTAVPFSAIGAVWLLWILGYHLSVTVWVGFIALFGLDAETGIFMLLYLDLARKARTAAGRLNTLSDLKEAIHDGAAKRLRPKMMTVCCAFFGLLPAMWSNGAGADVMKRIAAPMVGGLFTSFVLELLVYPAIYLLWHGRDVANH
jgi:Cu(I)/Ag(I) efflux system membrane protein CusA/SilA